MFDKFSDIPEGIKEEVKIYLLGKHKQGVNIFKEEDDEGIFQYTKKFHLRLIGLSIKDAVKNDNDSFICDIHNYISDYKTQKLLINSLADNLLASDYKKYSHTCLNLMLSVRSSLLESTKKFVDQIISECREEILREGI